MITLEQVEQFLTITKYMNFTKAAEAMYTSHSTISRTMDRLEKELGVKLFIRTNKYIALTKAGEVLAKKGKRMLHNVRDLETEIKTVGKGGADRLVISSGRIYIKELFDIFKLFKAKHPEVKLEMRNALLSQIVSDISNGYVDIGINSVIVQSDIPMDFKKVVLSNDKLCVIVADTHPLADLDKVFIRDLIEYGIISGIDAYRSGGERNIDLRRILFNQFDDRIDDFEDIDSAMKKVKLGENAVILSKYTSMEIGGGFKVFEIEDEIDSIYCDAMMFWHSVNSNPALKLFMEVFKEYKN